MSDVEIYKKAVEVLGSGGNVVLVTVISASGSTPGKVGYRMLVFGENGETVGTVGGGLSEAEVVETARGMLSEVQGKVVRFDLDGSGEEERGICGGSIEFLLETFDNKSLGLFTELSGAVESSSEGVLVSVLPGERLPQKVFVGDAGKIKDCGNADLSDETIKFIKKLAAEGRCGREISEGGVELFVEPVTKRPMVFIFGAGHLAKHISQYATSMCFGVTVCDDRSEFANRLRFPEADSIVVESFEAVVDGLEIGVDSYIVIVTKGHKSDEVVLARAVETEARYIGMIGSKRKTRTIVKKLLDRGITEEKLSRVYSPIGISIGAVTPEEIALSIVCELVKIRRLGDSPSADHMKMDLSEGV